MADSASEDLALGEEAVRRGLLTKEHLAEAQETQRLAVQAGLPITLAEVLVQRQYLNTVQIETLQRRLLEQTHTPAPALQNATQHPQRTGESTRALPRQPSPHVPTTGPQVPIQPPPSARAVGPFSPIPSTPSASPTGKRGSGRVPAVPAPSRRGSSISSQAVSPTSAPDAPPPSEKRASSRIAAVPPPQRGSSISSQAVSPPAAPDAPAPSEKRASSRSAAVPPPRRGSSISSQAVSPTSTPDAPPPSEKRASSRIAAVSPSRRSSSISAPAVSPAQAAGIIAGMTPQATAAAPVESIAKPPPAVAYGGGASENKPPVAMPAAETPETAKLGTVAAGAATPAGRGHSVARPATRPQKQKSKTFLWVFMVLLLLVGSNTVTWMVAKRTASEPTLRPQELSFGPSFEPLTYWLVVGPFPAKSGTDLDTVHEPENSTRNLAATMKGAKGPLKWKLAKMQANLISFGREFGEHGNCNGYGLTYVECPSETKALLGLGSDDSIRVWLNGEKVHENREARGCVVDQDRAAVTLKAGVNEILIKVGQGTGEWGFAATLRAPDGKPLPGLKGCLPKEIAIPEPPKPPEPAKKAAPATKTTPPAAPPAKPATPPTKPATTPTKPATPPATAPAKPATPPETKK